MRSPLRWIGGKSRSARTILDTMPSHKCYCEVFTGGGSVFFAKEPSIVEVLNDVNGELMNFYTQVQRRPRDVARRFHEMPHSRVVFNSLRSQVPLQRYKVARAARYLYLNTFCFGGRMNNPSFGYSKTRRLGRSPEETRMQLREVAERFRNVTFECSSWQSILRRFDGTTTVFYCDPPYYGMPYYQASFCIEDHLALSKALRKIKGRFLLSYNACDEIEMLYRWASLQKIKVPYGIGPVGKRVGRELLITNYKPETNSRVSDRKG
jgi:DNA adenine methylase